jgi:hypothetical protein
MHNAVTVWMAQADTESAMKTRFDALRQRRADWLDLAELTALSLFVGTVLLWAAILGHGG